MSNETQTDGGAPRRPRPAGRLVIDVTPASAFVAGALAVALLALAFNAGRYAGLIESNRPAKPPAAEGSDLLTLAEVRRTQPIDYANLTVDRGDAAVIRPR